MPSRLSRSRAFWNLRAEQVMDQMFSQGDTTLQALPSVLGRSGAHNTKDQREHRPQRPWMIASSVLAVLGIGTSQAIELLQAVATQQRLRKNPAPTLRVGLHQHQFDSIQQATKLMHQAGAMSPRTATADDQQGTSNCCRALLQQRLQRLALELRSPALIVAIRIRWSQAIHQTLPLPPPEATGRGHQLGRNGHNTEPSITTSWLSAQS